MTPSVIRIALYVAASAIFGVAGPVQLDHASGEIVISLDAVSEVLAGGSAVTIAGALAWWRRDVKKGKTT